MLRDEDRIFTNIYGSEGADLGAAKARGDWNKTADLIKKGRFFTLFRLFFSPMLVLYNETAQMASAPRVAHN